MTNDTTKKKRKKWTDEDLVAEFNFRAALDGQADAMRDGAPLWHGWAIRAAFLAGIDYARKGKK